MRRSEKEMTDFSDINAVIEKSRVCRLGMISEGKPYIVPLCFGYRENTLYFHSAQKGRKIDSLRENPDVCFEMDVAAEAVESEEACGWSMKFQSVIGFGKAEFIESLEGKRKALDIIMAQYSDRNFQFPENKVAVIAVIKVGIESITGKRSGF